MDDTDDAIRSLELEVRDIQHEIIIMKGEANADQEES